MITRLLATTVLILGVLLLTPSRASSQATDPASLVNAYLAAVNAGNINAVLGLFADNAVHEAAPPIPDSLGVAVGKGQIRHFYQQVVAHHDHLVLLGTPRASGGTGSYMAVTFKVRMSGDGVRSLGLAGLDVVVVATAVLYDQGYKFMAYTATLAPQSLAQLEGIRHAASGTSISQVTSVKVFPLADAPANDLPSGPATYQALHVIYPDGYTSKHVHGGPSYIYVIAGVFQVIDEKGTRTYKAGSFDFEPPGHVHTFHVLQAGTEIFSLRILPPGAQATIPVK